MHKFNDTGIFTGYIKQLLKEFNLPKVKVYSKKYQEYYDKYGDEHPEIFSTLVSTNVDDKYPSTIRYIPYIKNNTLQEYINKKWEVVGFRNHNKMKHSHSYTYGDKLLNYTKNLYITNNIYDSYTHEYLGDYLRFKRDYLGIDLMPLYNCFSNRTCDKLDLSWISYTNQFILDSEEESENQLKKTTHTFSTKDTNYKIYMIPIKLFQQYTIALDASGPIEMCCGVYGEYQDTREKFKHLPKWTYQRVTASQFSKPFLYTKTLYENLSELLNYTTLAELLQNENDLKLFLKIPKNNTSSIVILEGDYLHWNDRRYYKPEPQIISINYSGQGQPLSNELKNVATGSVYLDTVTANIYTKTDTAWKFSQNCILKNTIETDVQNRSILKQLIHIDPNNNYLNSTDKAKYTSDELLKINFNYYKHSSTNLKLDKNSIYFNSALNKVLIYPLDSWFLDTNYKVINLEKLDSMENLTLSSPLQLLQFNTNEHYAFADRLIEYLVENAISKEEIEVYDNVRRTQKVLFENRAYNNYNSIEVKGSWDNKMSPLLYEYMTTRDFPVEVKHDLLGYVDKDVEKYYSTIQTINGKIIKNSLLNTELTEEEM